LSGASQEQIDRAFEIYWATIQGSITTNYIINSGDLGIVSLRTSINDGLLSLHQSLTDFRDGISNAQVDINEAAKQPRDIIHTLQLAFVGLIILTLIVIAGIILIHRSVKGASRDLGITLTCYGIFELIGVLILRFTIGSIGFISENMPPGTPEFVADLVHLIIQKTTLVLLIFTIVVLVIGIALLVLSYLYKETKNKQSV
jgi:hypothetical protein